MSFYSHSDGLALNLLCVGALSGTDTKIETLS